MTALGVARADNASFAQLINVDMSIDLFASDWSNCDRMSTFLARVASHNRNDSLLYANLLSSVLNELFETIFRVHGHSGAFDCRMRRGGGIERIEMTFPCGREHFAFYQEALSVCALPDAPERYRAALFSASEIDPAIGLMELVVDYGATLALEPLDGGRFRLVAEVTFEEAAT